MKQLEVRAANPSQTWRWIAEHSFRNAGVDAISTTWDISLRHARFPATARAGAQPYRATTNCEHRRDGDIVGTYILEPNQPGLGSHVADAALSASPASFISELQLADRCYSSNLENGSRSPRRHAKRIHGAPMTAPDREMTYRMKTRRPLVSTTMAR